MGKVVDINKRLKRNDKSSDDEGGSLFLGCNVCDEMNWAPVVEPSRANGKLHIVSLVCMGEKCQGEGHVVHVAMGYIE